MARPPKPPDPRTKKASESRVGTTFQDRWGWWSEAAGPLPTPRTLLAARDLRLVVRCKACAHRSDADLQALIEAGRGDRPVRDLRFRCSVCHSRQTETAIAARR